MSIGPSSNLSAGPSLEPLPSPLLEELSRRYALERELGRGGMAVVWRARRLADGVPFAIKVLRPELAQAVASHRFVREIRISTEVRSSALFPVEEYGEAAGLPFYVMPLAEGGSLRERLLRQRQLGLGEAVLIARRVAIALAALHHAGFAHRDIKPENVLLSSDGEAYLADHGIAHALSAATKSEFTSTGVVIGTPPYMSPEQAGGEPVDARSDIYSLGCVLYEMLAGEPPFHGATPQAVLARHMHDPPPSLRVVRDTVPDRLERSVMRMLAKTPADRHQTASDVVAELGAMLDEFGQLSVRTSALSRRFGRRRRLVTGAALGVVGLAAWSAYMLSARDTPLDDSRVVVFPFTSVGIGAESTFVQVPMLVGSALERTAATSWLDGYLLLDEAERRAGGLPSSARARDIARREQARYFIDGAVSGTSDSVTVRVQLHDARTGRVVQTHAATGDRRQSVSDLTLRAMVQVMPHITGMDSLVDVGPLAGHNPAAVDNWLRGERAYREARMADGLVLLERAVAADSTLAPAAYRAAAVASWTRNPARARTLITLALRHPEALSARQERFARALERSQSGRADESIELLRPLLEREQQTPDAWMLAGEIQLHLLPAHAVGENPATLPRRRTIDYEDHVRQAFLRARALDGGFLPPLTHLPEISARAGDASAAASYARQLLRSTTDSVLRHRMTVMIECVRDGAAAIDWRRVADRSPATLYHVGFVLQNSSARRSRQCAQSAFEALLADSTTGATDWGALLGLHGMLAAQGERDRAIAIVDSAVSGGLPTAVGLYVLDEIAGLNPGPRADGFIESLFANIEGRGPNALWLMALWSDLRGDTTRLATVDRRLADRVRAGGGRLDSLMADVVGAYAVLARGDTSAAVRRLAALRPTAEHRDVEGSLWESLAVERLRLSQLLLATGDAEGAHRIASTFDHPGILVHQLFLRNSLEVRLRAAALLDDAVLQRRASDRLRALSPSR